MHYVSGFEATRAEQGGGDGQVDRVRGETRYRPRYRAAFQEFLTRPLLYVAGSILLAGLAIVHDRQVVPWGRFVQEHLAVVVPPQAASTLLSTVTPGLLTVVSIIFFVALMAVQHQSAKYSPVVLDQFMRRRINQIFFGLFIGLTAYFVLVLGLVPAGQAVVSGTVGLLLTVVTLVMLLVFLYNTMDQMRPSSAAWVLQNMARHARMRQEPLLARCRAYPRRVDAPATEVLARSVGYLVHIDGQALASALPRGGEGTEEVEVELRVRMGDHIVPGGTLAWVRGGSRRQRHQVAAQVLAALTVGRVRDVDRDASHAVDQLGSIAWSATAVSGDVEGARVAVESLHGVLTLFHRPDVHEHPDVYGGEIPLVYHDPIGDNVIDALTNVIAASAISGQHQSCAESLTILARALPHLSQERQHLVVERLERVLPAANRHLFTVELENGFDLLHQSMHEAGEPQSARRLQQIKDELRQRHRLAAQTNPVSGLCCGVYSGHSGRPRRTGSA